MHSHIIKLSKTILKNPVQLEGVPVSSTIEMIQHDLYHTITCLLTWSCGGSLYIQKSAYEKSTIEAQAIPPDLGKDSTILLCTIKRQAPALTRAFKEIIQEGYHGAFEFVEESDFYTNEKYLDFNTYRFVLDTEIDVEKKTKPDSRSATGSSSQYAAEYIFSVRDQLTEKEYRTPIKSQYYRHLLTENIQALDVYRRKNNP